MTNQLLQQYAKLTEFLGHTLGPDYEIVLHDFTDQEHSIIAIANNQVSGRDIGAPLTSIERKLLEEKRYEGRDYILHYRGMADNGKMLRSSTLFIREDGELAGMLCVNFDDSRYHAITEDILRLCHPDNFVETRFLVDSDRMAAAEEAPGAPRSAASGGAGDIARQRLAKLGIPAEELTQEDRMDIIAHLEENGSFLIKGAVKEVSEILACSQATVYRGIKQLRQKKAKAAQNM